MTDILSWLEGEIQSFKESDTRRDKLLLDMVQRLTLLDNEYKAKCRDYDNERTSRHHWQEKAENLERDLASLRTTVDGSSFVQVLIDGDASYFHDTLIRAGAMGASEAAHMLLTEIKSHIQPLGIGNELPILVNIYANLGGLSGKLTHIGLIGNPGDMYTFVRSFNTSQPLFNFVDVGSGKEKADHKLREMFRIQLANKQCKHIFFGGCHDNGYLTILEQYKHDRETASRITLIETLPAQAGFYALNFKMARFHSVFRSEALERTGVQNTLLLQDGPSTDISSPDTISRTSSAIGKTDLPLQTKTVAIKTAVEKPPVHSKPAVAEIASPPASWASAAVANGATDKTIKVARRNTPTTTRFILCNYDGYRLDSALPPATSNDIHNLHALMEQGKLCNEHFLKGKCSLYHCKYLHTGKLSAGELNALRHKARKLCCSKTDCDDYGCYCGHVCPFERNGRCSKEGCYFEDVHGIDREPWYKHYEDGRVDELKG